MNTHSKLREWLAKSRAGVVTEERSEDQIEALVRRYELSLPEDFRQYLREYNPAEDNWDEEMGNWWPLARIKNIPDEYEHEIPSFIPDRGRKFVFFLDHCIWCWAWAISCADDETRGKVVLIGGQNERFVADSFSDFVDRYTSDWLSVS